MEWGRACLLHATEVPLPPMPASFPAGCRAAPPPSHCAAPRRRRRRRSRSDKSQPIWVSLSEGRTELYREILQLEHGNCPYLEQ